MFVGLWCQNILSLLTQFKTGLDIKGDIVEAGWLDLF